MYKSNKQDVGRIVALRKATLEIEKRWGIRASGRFFSLKNQSHSSLVTGINDFDRATGFEGIPRARLTEIMGGISSGKMTLAVQLLKKITEQGGLAACIDMTKSLYPPSLEASGVDLDRLLIVRPTEFQSAFQSAFILLGREAFELVLILINQNIPRSSYLARITALISHKQVACVLLTTPQTYQHTNMRHFASLRVATSRNNWLWSDGPLGRVLKGARLRIDIIKSRSSVPTSSFMVDFSFPGSQIYASNRQNTVCLDATVSNITRDNQKTRVEPDTISHLLPA
tara:strand:- start:2206 stop:3060 length:855 start_codon:yes stop_codon:yes gene_type:complete